MSTQSATQINLSAVPIVPTMNSNISQTIQPPLPPLNENINPINLI